ncbi:transposase [Paraburkholderia sp. JPY169]|uniref:Transposase n=1 Tax=Paraburkholderia youngii TaxID=2782701 RepID=A0A7Y6N4W8_9BURK|nr:transposase [Paraburkholderia youngii]
MRLLVDDDAPATPLREEDRRRGQLDGGDYCAGHQSRQSRHVQTCDIPYHTLDETYRQYCRLATLRAANDRVANFIAQLPIFEYYSSDLGALFGAIDGQKFAAATPTAKARHSRKYFGRERGVVAFTSLTNHVATLTNLIGAHEHESHYVFDLCYHNTTDIASTIITGDMHSINKMNFAAMTAFNSVLLSQLNATNGREMRRRSRC